MKESIQSQLEHHWMLDSLAAGSVATQLSDDEVLKIQNVTAELSQNAISARDHNRQEIGDIFTGASSKKLIVLGPCSLDTDAAYTGLFDYIQELQSDHPDAVIAFRGNGAKPRTGTGWTGLFYGSEQDVKMLFDIYTQAAERGIPILTEITEAEQLGALAPFLSGVWVGARDVESTALRGKFSAYHLPVAIKNGRTGDVNIVEKAVETVRANSKKNDNSRVILGQLAMQPDSPGVATKPVLVSEGNSQVGIIARGYELPGDISKKEKRKAAIKHLSDICMLGSKVGCAVLIDGTHSVPPMFDIDKKGSQRFLHVLKKFHVAIRKGEIMNPEQIRGIMGEVGTETGRTDPNLILNIENSNQLRKLIRATLRLLT